MLIDKEFNVKEVLLTHKNIEPLNFSQVQELKRIEGLDVGGFSEADVRAEVIDPIVRLLGYGKGQVFSVDREKHIRFLGKTSRYIDYSCTVWREDFWIIEAKKPLKGSRFGYKELSQAVEYAIHPEINASIIMICDGLKIEVFDRDEDVENPVLSFEVVRLYENFDELRKILSPINLWFFYKRRVLRAIDRAFEAEFNQARVDEFFDIVRRRLDGKRSKIHENFRTTKFADRSLVDVVSAASFEEIVDLYYFYPQSRPVMSAMNQVLLKAYEESPFKVMFKIFPDGYRDANESYYMNAISFLIELEGKVDILTWVPSWLSVSQTRKTEDVIGKLLNLLLSYFKSDDSRKAILLASSTYRRIFKAIAVVRPDQQRAGQLTHALMRFNFSELSWHQIVSSPERNVLIDIDSMTINATSDFVAEFSAENRMFKVGLAKLKLAELWELESSILSGVSNYDGLLRERDYGEIFPTEASSVVYDNLGHGCLCVVKESEKWKSYVITNHFKDLIELVGMGSWSAREIVGDAFELPVDDGRVSKVSERFFWGDIERLKSLAGHYGLSVS